MRLIDADALKVSIDEGWNNGACKRCFFEEIDPAPTVDAVLVVRCKDCKHWGMHKRLNVPWCFEMHIDKSEDGFCDGGERRE